MSILDLPELLRSISANTRRVLGCDAVGVILMDEPSGEARLSAVEFPGSCGVLAEGLVLPVAGTPLEEVLRTGRPGNLGIPDEEAGNREARPRLIAARPPAGARQSVGARNGPLLASDVSS